jgi:hypothetical protein
MRDRRLAFVMGLALGVGVLVKQHAALVAILAGAWLVWVDREGWRRRLAAFVAGLGLPLLAAGVWLLLQGTLGEAWYWIVQYTFESDYAREAALAPPAGEWLVLGALYASLLGFVLAVWLGLVPMRVAALLLGLAAVATLPVWPRYGRFHLGAALPLLAVAGGVAAVLLWRDLREREVGGKLLSAVGLLAVALGGIIAAAQSWQVLVEWKQLGEPRAPYDGSTASLRAWVDSVSPPDEPVFTYGLDLLLYRVLERESPIPFVPQLPWILKAHDAEGKMWSGVEREEPRVVLVDASWWDGTPAPERAAQSWPGISRYREAARFSIVSYPGAQPVSVVGLVRDR